MTKLSKLQDQPVHFWSNDYRFCGSTQTCRPFSFEDDEVTCPHCLKRAAEALAQFTALIPAEQVKATA